MEASLNNFSNQTIFDILVTPSRERLLKHFAKPIGKNTLTITIYSKNNKRKWPKDSLK